MDKKRIEMEMKELEIILNYRFDNINLLSNAMCSSKINIQYPKEYFNEGLATVGDAILKLVLAVNLYDNGITSKGQITIEKSKLENNRTLYDIAKDLQIINYAYNENYFYKDNPPDHEKVSNSLHSPYIEAIICAIYYDSNFETCKKWILTWLLPLLKDNKCDGKNK